MKPLYKTERSCISEASPAAPARAAGYIRVSTEEQVRGGVSLDAQEERVRAYCTMSGMELVSVIREEGVSGAKPLDSRPRGKAVDQSGGVEKGGTRRRAEAGPDLPRC